ncbi:TPA: hypothetical protein ACQTZL_003763 [Pseudomonas aeruginosa]
MTTLRLDWETASEIDLPKYGLDVYSAHPSTRILMGAYQFDSGRVQHWDTADTDRMPAELREALEDPHVIKKAFNAQFERVIARRVAGLKVPYQNWRCTMALAYQHSFVGTLGDIGQQMGLPDEMLKSKEGDRLIQLFSKPQRITKNQPHRWRDSFTDPDEWERFGAYNVQDVVSEGFMEEVLSRYEMLASEWQLYELDQRINDRGLPVDMEYVESAIHMAARRKAELLEEMAELTGLANPNSTSQLLPWLQDRGYPFSDLVKDTVKKVLREDKQARDDEAEGFLDDDAVKCLRLRLNASRTSTSKYTALKVAVGRKSRIRFCFQFGGASRTNRWSGRRFQPQNLTRTPKDIEPNGGDHYQLAFTTELIRRGDYDGLSMMIGEPMDALAGCIRSAIRAPHGYELRVCDLSSIETCVIAWLAGCVRLLNVIRGGKDPYKDFGTVLFRKPYEEVTKKERGDSKPAVLGSGYRLGGGDLKEGKRTGLWGYAENMGVDMSREMAHQATKLFRDTYHEIPKLWFALERAVERCLKTSQEQVCGPLRFIHKPPYLLVRLPSGRFMHYFKPKIVMRTPPWGGEKKKNFSYMAQPQGKKTWVRITSHGGKLVENFVQAIARDILKEGLLVAHAAGFNIVGHVHDEIITLQPVDDQEHTLDALKTCMTRKLDWCPDLPLGAAGWCGPFYMKD